jgi:hypothetical protein
MKLTKYKTDQVAEREGKWVPWHEGSRLLIARAGNPKFQAVLQKQMEPHTAVLRAGGSPPEGAQEAAIVAATAEGCLLGWEGLDDDDGVAIPYSPAKAVELLTEYTDLRTFVQGIAADRAQYSASLILDSAKNS